MCLFGVVLMSTNSNCHNGNGQQICRFRFRFSFGGIIIIIFISANILDAFPNKNCCVSGELQVQISM